MEKINFELGESFRFVKTIGESDVYLFAGIVGDFSPYHTDAQYVREQGYDTRLVHGALVFAFSSTTAMLAVKKTGQPALSYGYERVRFVRPLFMGDTLTTTYTIAEIDEQAKKSFATVTATNQHGDVICVSTHILKFMI